MNPRKISESSDNSCPICFESFDISDKISCERCNKEICSICSAKWTKSCPFCNKQNEVNDIERQNPLEQELIPRAISHDTICYRKLCEILFILIAIITFYFFFFQPIYLNNPDKQQTPSNITNSTKVASSTLHKLYNHQSP